MSNLTWHQHPVSKRQREQMKGQKASVLWFTGFSGSGKSTIAGALEQRLHELGAHSYILDGDNIRHGLCGDLGFSDKDRVENIRRVGEVSRLMVDAGLLVLTAFISPFRSDRDMARKLFNEGEFIEVFVDAPLSVCEKRDPKGLYAKARKGDIDNFTGIDSEYQAPSNPEITLSTDEQTIEESVEAIVNYLTAKGYLEQ